jgi:hypothetical protein
MVDSRLTNISSWTILMHEAIQEARYLAVYDMSVTDSVRAAGEAVNDINI